MSDNAIKNPYSPLALLGALLLGACDDYDVRNVTRLRDEAVRNLAEEKAEQKEWERKVAELEKGEQQQLKAELASLVTHKQELIEEMTPMEVELRKNAKLLEIYQSTFQESSMPLGSPLGNVTLLSGGNLEGAVLTAVSRDTLGIRHSKGVGTFPLSEFPKEISRRFIFAPVSTASTGIDPAHVLLSKPEFLMTGDQRQERDRFIAARKSEEEMAAANAKRAAEQAAMALQAKAASQLAAERSEISAKIAVLREKEGQLTANRIQFERLIRDAISENNSRTIKRSQIDLEKSLEPQRAQIAVIQKEINAVRKEIAELEEILRRKI